MGDLPDIRATDADRERTVTVLRASGANGQLTVDELDERVDAAYAARTRGALERLVGDLGEPRERSAGLPVRPGEDGTRWVVSVMGGSDRKGHWRVGRSVTVLNLMGGSNLDLNDAELAADVVEMRVYSLMGGSDIQGPMRMGPELNVTAIMGGHDVDLNDAVLEGGELTVTVVSIMGGSDFRVPEGVHVVHDVGAIMGGDSVEPPSQPPAPGAPVIRFRGLSLMGGNSIKRGRKEPRTRR